MPFLTTITPEAICISLISLHAVWRFSYAACLPLKTRGCHNILNLATHISGLARPHILGICGPPLQCSVPLKQRMVATTWKGPCCLERSLHWTKDFWSLHFIWMELKKVPITRMVSPLNERLVKSPRKTDVHREGPLYLQKGTHQL